MFDLNPEIKIVMRAGLLAKQRIDAPSTQDNRIDPCDFKGVEHVMDVKNVESHSASEPSLTGKVLNHGVKFVALVFAVALVGCSADAEVPRQMPPSMSVSELSDPCALLTRVEVEMATGSNVTSVERGIDKVTNEKSGCLYRSDGPYGVIVVGLTRGGADAALARLQQESLDGANIVEAVGGLGDEAFLTGRTELIVVTGTDVVMVATQRFALDGPAVLQELAAMALQRV